MMNRRTPGCPEFQRIDHLRAANSGAGRESPLSWSPRPRQWELYANRIRADDVPHGALPANKTPATGETE